MLIINDMPARYINIDRATPMLLPPDLREWVPENHLVHFIIETVDSLDLSAFRCNERGTGSAQFPPAMMLSLLIYGYATGRFSSREIERASYEDVAVRYLCAGYHPDHDTLCTFRRQNLQAFSALFVRVLAVANESGVMRKVGTISVDGTKIKANASKHSAVSYEYAQAQITLLDQEVKTLLEAAEQADRSGTPAKTDLPAEITRRTERKQRIKQAIEQISARHEERLRREQKDYEAKVQERQQRRQAGEQVGGNEPKPPSEQVPANAQYNYTDPESRIMKAGNGQHFEQGYNAQAAVETESMLIVGAHVTNAPNDREQLVPTLASVAAESFTPKQVLADSGYYSQDAIKEVEAQGETTALVAVGKQQHGVTLATILGKSEELPAPGPDAPFTQVMRHRLQSKEGAALYRLRKQTVEPVFGIIKQVLGFRQFLLRGVAKVSLEWKLVCTAYNIRRVFKLLRAMPAPAMSEIAVQG
jgi:transposase